MSSVADISSTHVIDLSDTTVKKACDKLIDAQKHADDIEVKAAIRYIEANSAASNAICNYNECSSIRTNQAVHKTNTDLTQARNAFELATKDCLLVRRASNIISHYADNVIGHY